MKKVYLKYLQLTVHLCYVGGLITPFQLCATINFCSSPTFYI